MQRGVFNLRIVKGVGICLWYIYCITIDISQFRAKTESIITNIFHSATNGDGSKADAIIERITINACHAVGNNDRSETGAPRERTFTNACHAIGDNGILTSSYQRIR